MLISGSTGLIGTALIECMQHHDHEMVRLVRPGTRIGAGSARLSGDEKSVPWNPASTTIDSAADGADAVVHLAGASIAGGRWTAARKRELRASRVAATRNLVTALGALRRPPKIFVAASAIGIYGSRGSEELTESSAPGNDFLAHLTREWETESAHAADFGARTVLLRFGVILASGGGALPRMALPFRLGVGGRIGSGRQWISWIAIEDVIGIIRYALATGLLSGSANVVAPAPVTNAEFAATLGRVLHRPAILPTPAIALRLAFGEMADALLLSSQRVYPNKVQHLGYTHLHPELEEALRSELGKSR